MGIIYSRAHIKMLLFIEYQRTCKGRVFDNNSGINSPVSWVPISSARTMVLLMSTHMFFYGEKKNIPGL